MPLQLYNSQTRKKESFTPLNEDRVSYYTCGPTVYDFVHIGNLRTYIFEDVLRRVLQFNGYSVQHVMNITDVGHLTDDADAGEDKMEKGARREGKTAWEIASYYTEAFMEDARALNILAPSVLPRATDHIKDQIAMIKTLEEKGFAYQTADGVYFDTAKFPEYGKMAQLDIAGLQEGARVEKNPEKRHATDFALWKFSPSKSTRAMEWDSPWGIGFPGWHIECSAMSMRFLGETIDIHAGGVDHKPVHHTNEIAQSEAATGKPFVRYWLHGEFLLVDNGRMGKSEGNFITLSAVREKGFDPLAYRLYVLGAHYRSKLNFSWEAMKGAQSSYDKLVSLAAGWDEGGAVIPEYIDLFTAAINDDMNMPEALSILWKLVKSDQEPGDTLATALKMDEVLGLSLGTQAAALRKKIAAVGSPVHSLLNQRAAARAKKAYAESDALRDQIAALGFQVEDTDDGQILKAKKD